MIKLFYLEIRSLRFTVFVKNTLIIKASCAVYSCLKASTHIAELPYEKAYEHRIVMEMLYRVFKHICLIFFCPVHVVEGMISVERRASEFTHNYRLMRVSERFSSLSEALYELIPIAESSAVPSEILIYAYNVAVFKANIVLRLIRSKGNESVTSVFLEEIILFFRKKSCFFSCCQYFVMHSPEDYARMVIIVFHHFTVHFKSSADYDRVSKRAL